MPNKVTMPFAIDALLASTVEALKVTGEARSIAALVEGDCKLVYWGNDFDIDSWKLLVSLPLPFYYAMSDAERQQTQESIEAAMRPLFLSRPADTLDSVAIVPSVVEAKDGWREEAMRYVRGEGLTNQGRVRSDNIAAKQHKGLLFRSTAEITLFEALTRAGLPVSPLPVFVRIGKSYNRIEPDFLVISKGMTFLVEVDGDTYHRELPAEADRRLVPLTYEGVEVRRVRAVDLGSSEAADKVVRELMDYSKRRLKTALRASLESVTAV